MEAIISKSNNWIGKDMILQDQRDPLGGTNKT